MPNINEIVNYLSDWSI